MQPQRGGRWHRRRVKGRESRGLAKFAREWALGVVRIQ